MTTIPVLELKKALTFFRYLRKTSVSHHVMFTSDGICFLTYKYMFACNVTSRCYLEISHLEEIAKFDEQLDAHFDLEAAKISLAGRKFPLINAGSAEISDPFDLQFNPIAIVSKTELEALCQIPTTSDLEKLQVVNLRMQNSNQEWCSTNGTNLLVKSETRKHLTDLANVVDYQFQSVYLQSFLSFVSGDISVSKRQHQFKFESGQYKIVLYPSHHEFYHYGVITSAKKLAHGTWSVLCLKNLCKVVSKLEYEKHYRIRFINQGASLCYQIFLSPKSKLETSIGSQGIIAQPIPGTWKEFSIEVTSFKQLMTLVSSSGIFKFQLLEGIQLDKSVLVCNPIQFPNLSLALATDLT